MEVTRTSQFFLIATVIIFLSACGQTQTEEVFPLESQSCLEQSIPHEYLVSWKTGELTVEQGEDRQSFINNFVSPNLDRIEHIESHKRIQIETGDTQDYSFTAGEIDNWGARTTGASEAWKRGFKGEGVIVAVVDSGVDRTHNQLAGQIYSNPGETGLDDNGIDKRQNGIDDDNNGYIDDYAGYDFTSDSGEVEDTSSHGTHVAGIIAAHHNDTEISTEHVQGVAPEATLLPIDFIGPAGGTTADAVLAIDYAVKMGAKVINASWGGGPCSTTLGQRIRQLENDDVLFINAAGNGQPGRNIDEYIEYPASFNLAPQITVGSITSYGGMARHSIMATEMCTFLHLALPSIAPYPSKECGH